MILAEDVVKNRHEIICQYTWGSVPVDKDWAIINSPRYKDTEEKLIKWGFIKPLIIINKPENKRKL